MFKTIIKIFSSNPIILINKFNTKNSFYNFKINVINLHNFAKRDSHNYKDDEFIFFNKINT